MSIAISRSHLLPLMRPYISNVIIKNWLLNPTGKEDAFVEVDLVQEHLNYWIKVRTPHHSQFNFL